MPPQKRKGAQAAKGAAGAGKKAPPAPTKMDIGPKIDMYPELEEKCLEFLQSQYEDLMGAPPLPEIIDYVMTIGVRSDSSRAVVFENFHVLFKDKTEVLVKYLFDTLQPAITHCFNNLQKGLPIDQPEEEDDGEFDDGEANNQKGGKQKGNDKQKQGNQQRDSRDSRGGNNAGSSQGGRDQRNQRDNRDGGRDGGRDSRGGGRDGGRDGGVKQGRDDKFASKGGDRAPYGQSNDRNDRRGPQGAPSGQGQGKPEQKSYARQEDADPPDCKCKSLRGGKYGANPPCFTCARAEKAGGSSSRGGDSRRDAQAGSKRGRGEDDFGKHGDATKRQNRGDGAPGEDPPHNDQNGGGQHGYGQQDDGFGRKPSFDQGGRGGRGGYDQGGRGGRGGYDQGGRGGRGGFDQGGRGGGRGGFDQGGRGGRGGFDGGRGGRGGYDQGGRGGRGGFDGGRGGGRGGFDGGRGRGGFDGGRGGRGGFDGGRGGGRGGFDGGRGGRGGFDGGRGGGRGGFDGGRGGRGGFDGGRGGGRGGYDQGGRGGYGQHDGGFMQRGRGGFDGGRGRGGFDGGRGRGGYDQGGYGRGGHDQFGRGGHGQYGNHQNEKYPGESDVQKRQERFGAGNEKQGGSATGKEEGLHLQKQKSKIRCMHWPDCKTEATCEYFHPSEPCTFFPKCNRGDKCLYVHPDIACKFEDSCTRMNCSYKHSPAQTRKRQQMMANPLLMMMNAMSGASRGGLSKQSSRPAVTGENGKTGGEKPAQASVAKSDSAAANTTNAPDSAQLPAKTETQTQNLEQPVQQQMVSTGPREEGEC